MEVWLWRIMTRTSWIEHIKMNEVNEKRTMINIIMRRITKLIKHLLRNNSSSSPTSWEGK